VELKNGYAMRCVLEQAGIKDVLDSIRVGDLEPGWGEFGKEPWWI
jgi:hypothetical protein